MNALRHLRALVPDWTLEGLGVGAAKIPFDGSVIGPGVGWNQIHVPSRVLSLAEALNVVPPLETFVGRMDVMLGTAYITRKTRDAAEIPVIYDLSVIRYPSTLPRRRVLYLKKWLPVVLRRASGVVTISAAMKEEIAGHFGFDPRRIYVAAPGCSLHLFAPEAASGPRPVEGDYLLAVGTIEPRKNLQGLLEAYRALKKRRPDSPPLVLVGGMGWRSKGFGQVLEQDRSNGRVRWLGYVAETVLADLYRNAMGFVYPSFYEGFGMPIVEAMAAGCPVITSTGSGTAEAAGDAALLVDPRNIDQLGHALERLIDDRDLRATMRAKGLVRAKQFTWEKTARDLHGAITNAVEFKRS